MQLVTQLPPRGHGRSCPCSSSSERVRWLRHVGRQQGVPIHLGGSQRDTSHDALAQRMAHLDTLLQFPASRQDTVRTSAYTRSSKRLCAGFWLGAVSVQSHAHCIVPVRFKLHILSSAVPRGALMQGSQRCYAFRGKPSWDHRPYSRSLWHPRPCRTPALAHPAQAAARLAWLADCGAVDEIVLLTQQLLRAATCSNASRPPQWCIAMVRHRTHAL